MAPMDWESNFCNPSSARCSLKSVMRIAPPGVGVVIISLEFTLSISFQESIAKNCCTSHPGLKRKSPNSFIDLTTVYQQHPCSQNKFRVHNWIVAKHGEKLRIPSKRGGGLLTRSTTNSGADALLGCVLINLAWVAPTVT